MLAGALDNVAECSQIPWSCLELSWFLHRKSLILRKPSVGDRLGSWLTQLQSPQVRGTWAASPLIPQSLASGLRWKTSQEYLATIFQSISQPLPPRLSNIGQEAGHWMIVRVKLWGGQRWKRCFLDMTELMHSWTQSSCGCLYKVKTVSLPARRKKVLTGPHSLLNICWQLTVARRRKLCFLQGCDSW